MRCPYCSILRLCVGRRGESCDHRSWFLLMMCHVQHSWGAAIGLRDQISSTPLWWSQQSLRNSFIYSAALLSFHQLHRLLEDWDESFTDGSWLCFLNLISRWFYHKYYEWYCFGLRHLRSCSGRWCFFVFDTQSSNLRFALYLYYIYIILYYIYIHWLFL